MSARRTLVVVLASLACLTGARASAQRPASVRLIPPAVLVRGGTQVER